MAAVRVLLDTNIVLDFFSGRMGDDLAARLVQLGRHSQFEMCISFLTAINTLYVVKKMGLILSPGDLTRFFTILPQDAEQWADAQTLGMDDFEDAVQVACALRNSSFIAVSRDRDFSSAPLVTMTPDEFLRAVTNSSDL